MTWGAENKHLWSIILAGGEGERLRAFVERWQGSHKPKQYCTFVGTRSMFQHTVDRADRLGAPERKVIVVARSHLQEVTAQLADREPGKLVVQPSNRDTAAGVFLALAHVRARDPQAIVVVYPSDHFVYPESRFAKAVEAGVRAVELLADQLILLAVVPDKMEQEYGWICPGGVVGSVGGYKLRRVDVFVEKPNSTIACQFLLSQGLWNTLILAARVETVWAMGGWCFPELMGLFEKYEGAIGTRSEHTVLESLYTRMPRRNFSSDLLQVLPNQVAAIEMTEVLWSDWGKLERIVDTLQRIGKAPAFPVEHAITV